MSVLPTSGLKMLHTTEAMIRALTNEHRAFNGLIGYLTNDILKTSKFVLEVVRRGNNSPDGFHRRYENNDCLVGFNLVLDDLSEGPQIDVMVKLDYHINTL